MMKKAICIAWCVLAVSMAAYGRSYYFCDFEDAKENQLWQLNTPKNDRYSWKDLWCIGTATACDGQRSMYISTDDGATAGYAKESYVLIAWREFDDLEAGEYDLAFDWRNVGDSLRAGMYVAWVPEAQWGDMRCGQNDDLAGREWITDNLLSLDGRTLLHNSSVWSHSVGKLTVDGTPHRLVFVFRQSGNAAVRNPGACVDNVQIARNNCGTPTDLQVTVNGAYATLTWKSSAQAFNLRYTKQGSATVNLLENLTTSKVVLPLEHGVYNVYIQVICNGETSVWYSFPVVLVYESKCFNYLDLQDDQCFYVAETASNWHDNEGTLEPGKIDHGFMSDQSRHTIHYMEDEYDARTYNSFDSHGNPVSPLRTIPDGEIASVRIGSWEESAHVARVVYDFTVDTEEASVLMLKYALVLQSSGHEEPARPRFTLKIVDGDTGKELSTCTTVDFAAQTSGDGWYRSPAKSLSEPDARDVCWRDWTTVGLNLTDFDGTHVRIILTAYGCTASVHFGYAYFTLNCTSGNIEGINCGDTPTNEFVAPEGFNYRWYAVANPDVTLSTERVFPVKYDDDTEYMVDVIYKTNAACGFTLTACAIPRYPVPAATYEVYQENCRNYIRFHNDSHVRTKNLKTGEVIEYSKYPIEYTVWNYGTLAAPSTDWEETIEAPAEGGRFTVTLGASVGLCEETLTIDVEVPAIGADSIVETHSLCEGDRFTYQGKSYYTETLVVFQGTSRYGCDSTFYLDLHFSDVVRISLSDTILAGTTYLWEVEGQDPMPLTEAGTYTMTIPQTSGGCDSVLTLTLYVMQGLTVELISVETPCFGQTAFDVAYRTGNGSIERISAMLAEQEVEVLEHDDTYARLSLPAELEPGYYPLSLVVHNEELGDCELTAELELRYPAAMVQQRWDDVLGILNEEYNGGYVFTAYQWYKDGTAVEGAVSPYYYEQGGLAAEAAYSVSLLREGDARALRTCDYRPVVFTPAENAGADKPRKYLQDGHLYIAVDGYVYDASGMRK